MRWQWYNQTSHDSIHATAERRCRETKPNSPWDDTKHVEGEASTKLLLGGSSATCYIYHKSNPDKSFERGDTVRILLSTKTQPWTLACFWLIGLHKGQRFTSKEAWRLIEENSLLWSGIRFKGLSVVWPTKPKDYSFKGCNRGWRLKLELGHRGEV